MCKTPVVLVAIVLLLTIGPAPVQANESNEPCCQDPNENTTAVQAVLDLLEARAADLTSFQCSIDYLFKQPLLESQALQKGTLYYAKFDDRSYLRVDFDTVRYDQEKEQKRREQFFFDGVWVTYIDHQVKSAQRQQMADPNEPVDAFTLISRRVPVLGFSKVDELHKQFEIKLAPEPPSKPSSSFLLHMKVKPDSLYKDDYTTIDFHVDKEHGLPVRIVALSAQEDLPEKLRDVHEIKLMAPKINKGIRKSRFNVKIPKRFSVEVKPLERRGVPK